MKKTGKGKSETVLLKAISGCARAVEKAVEKTLGYKTPVKIEIAKEFGDLALPCFPFAARAKRNPREIADAIAHEFNKKPSVFIDRADSVNGFVNFFLNGEFYARVLEESLDGKYGSGGAGKEKILVEMSSPNTNKPLHLG
ncbi:MAG TPA: hypothetical protein VJI71_02440, partial [Candidatus Norongarragalinales archaeon]|nr:hypothetical protein [Candidatus Norongarragalinales archaeon]